MADSIAITPEDPFYLRNSTNSTRGWAFTVETEGLVVSKLGIFDEGLDGLIEPHRVSIWTGTGEPVVSTMIPSGDSTELQGVFRYLEVPPTPLINGEYYVIGAYYGSDADHWADTDDADKHSAIFYRIDQSGTGDSFPEHSGRGVDPGFFGPNFQFLIVPEPPSWTDESNGGLGLLYFGLPPSSNAKSLKQFRDRTRTVCKGVLAPHGAQHGREQIGKRHIRQLEMLSMFQSQCSTSRK